MTPPIGRYAPSPTGSLHLGNLRTALAAYLSIRARGGRFLLRVEDIDRGRSRPAFEARQLDDLRRLGVDWDAPPVRQSERTALYEARLAELHRAPHVPVRVFPCFCTRRDLRDAASAPHAEGVEPPYPGHCLALAPDDVRDRLASGRQHALRVTVPPGPVAYREAFHGIAPGSPARDAPIDLAGNGGAFVLRRADGEWAYQFACAVDDVAQGITEVVRGDDLVVSAARQAWLMRALGAEPPEYHHLPLMVAGEGTRLSKRSGDADLDHWLAHGLTPEGVRGYLAWTLGIAEPGESPPIAALIARWDWARCPRRAPVFRPQELMAFR